MHEHKNGCCNSNIEEPKHEHNGCCGINHSEHEDEVVGCSCCGIDLGEPEHTSCCGVDLGSTKKKGLNKYWWYLIISLPLLVLSFLLTEFKVYTPRFTSLFDPAWAVVALCGLPIYRGAIKNLKRKKITAALLISIAMTASLIMGILTSLGVGGTHGHGSYFFAAGEVAFLMTLGQQIEGVTVKKSRSAIESLIDVTPVLATLKTESGYVDVNVNEVSVGDTVLTRPHEVIPVDGEVISGYGFVDTSSITGEYAPQEVTVGSYVYAGTTNLDTAIEINVARKNEDTTLSKLIAYVKNAEKNKAPFVRLADKWASYVVPTTCTLSLIVFLIALFAFKIEVVDAVQRAITVLIVVCPCAMTLATPIAVAAGIGNASKKGILVKSGIALESISKVNTVCFDKTGTITAGKITVEDVYPYGIEKEELLKLAASAEAKSEHLIGKAITAYYQGELYESEETESLIGKGIKAKVNNKTIEVLKLSECASLAPESAYASLLNSGATVVGVIIDGEYKGAISIADTLRPDAQKAITACKECNLNTYMLTGDNDASARKTALAVGIENVYASLLPDGKVNVIEELKANANKVLMVGDGVNDAPSMSASNCSLAMGAMGNSVAIETADVSLLNNDLLKIPFLVKLSRATFRLIKFNIVLSLCISLTSVILSTLGILNAVSGALVHNASSVYVCLSASLLLLYKGKTK
ncbi:MAG: cadmium-translocating P-type ATPase [Clostridia bacterium]|nr:cadmium-translocating P-type ATPase [Clostridia bacterium]